MLMLPRSHVGNICSLAKGTVDGAMVPLECLKSYAFGEVIGYVTMLNMAVGPTHTE